MTELTDIEVLRRIDGPVEPPPDFSTALFASLREELERGPVAEPERPADPKRSIERRRLPVRIRPPRRTPWLRPAIALAAAVAIVVGVVIVPLPTGTNDAAAVMREARTAFSHLPAFQASTVQRMVQGGSHLVIRREIDYLDATHFENRVMDASWSPEPTAAAAEEVQSGEYWQADGVYFGHYLPSSDTFIVQSVQDESALAFFAAGMLDPQIEWMAHPSDAYISQHCDVLPDASILGRSVHRLACRDQSFDVVTSIDAETGMLFRLESRDEGTLFEVRSIDLAPTFAADDFVVRVPEGAAISWMGGGTPPAQFRQVTSASVKRIPLGNAPEMVVAGGDAIWASYTEGGTGDNAVGGRQAVARIDPTTGRVVARIVMPTDLTQVPKGWSSPLVFVSDVLPTDVGVFVSYWDAGDGTPAHVAMIDPATNVLGPPILTLTRTRDESGGAGLAFLDGSLWVSDAHGGEVVRTPTGDPWSLAAILEVDPISGKILRKIPLPMNAFGLVAGDDALWLIGISYHGADASVALLRVDPSSGEVSSYRIPQGNTAMTFGEGAVWVYNDSRHQLYRVDPSTGLVAQHTTVRAGLEGSMAAGEGRVLITNGIRNALLVIDPGTGEVVAEVTVGAMPLGVAVADGALWVANYRDASISRVQI